MSREGQLDAGAVSDLTGESNRTAMRLDDCFTDGQAQSRPAVVAGTTCFHSIEAIEDPILVGDWDAIASVGHPQANFGPDRLAADSDTACRRGVCYRVVDQINQDLDQQIFISRNRR